MPKKQLQKIEHEMIERRIEAVCIEVCDIKEDIEKIKDNHLFHIEKDVESIKTNQDWLMRFFWVVSTSSIGALITSLFNLWEK